VKLFTPRKPAEKPEKAADVAARLEEMSARLDRLEQVITELRHNTDLLPAIIRKLYLDDVELPPPYDLLAGRFGLTSQNEEDGLLLALFKRIGAPHRRFVEIGCGGNGGNGGFFAKHLGWSGMMIDARGEAIDKVKLRYAGHDVTAVRQRVSREGVNALLEQFGFTGEIDLLSIDIDGNDYWIWEAITACQPRVAIVEYNWILGAQRAVTIPYTPTFSLRDVDVKGYRGASLAAMVHLGTKKGYRLVASERVNAVFLRNDIAPEIPAITVAQGYRPPLNLGRSKDLYEKLERANLPLVDVTAAATV